MEYVIEVSNTDDAQSVVPTSTPRLRANTIAGACFAIDNAIARRRGLVDGSRFASPDQLGEAMRKRGTHKMSVHGLQFTITRQD